MKQSYLILWSLITGPLLLAQQDVVVSGGDASGSGGSASFTVGQVVYTTLTGTGGTANQGVQQPYEIYVLGNDAFEDIKLEAIAYPNPTVTTVQLEIRNASGESFHYRLFDINGRLLQSDSVHQSNSLIDMQRYPSAVYLLKVYSGNKELKTFKIIKKDI